MKHDMIQRTIFKSDGGCLSVAKVCYLYQKINANAQHGASKRDLIYNYTTTDKDGIQTLVNTADLNPMLRFTYELGKDATGNRIRAEWNNSMYLVEGQLYDLIEFVLDPLYAMLNDPEAFTIDDNNFVTVAQKYANVTVGFESGNVSVIGRLHGMKYDRVEPGTNNVYTESRKAVVLTMTCGNNNGMYNDNVLTDFEFKNLRAKLKHTNLEEWVDMLHTTYNFQQQQQQYEQTQQKQQYSNGYNKYNNTSRRVNQTSGVNTSIGNTRMPVGQASAYGQQPAPQPQVYSYTPQAQYQQLAPQQTYTAPQQSSGMLPPRGNAISQPAAPTFPAPQPTAQAPTPKETIVGNLSDLIPQQNVVSDDGLDDVDVPEV